MGVEGAAVLFQGLEVALAVIRGVVFPAGVIDADEFVGHSPAGLVVFAVGFAFLVVIIAFGPRLLFEGAAGVFMKSLATELGAAAAHVDRFSVAALFDDGGDPIKLGDRGGTGKTVAFGAKGHQQARGQGRAGTGQAAEESRVGMLVEGLGISLSTAAMAWCRALSTAASAVARWRAGAMIASSSVRGLALAAAARRFSIFSAPRLLCL